MWSVQQGLSAHHVQETSMKEGMKAHRESACLLLSDSRQACFSWITPSPYSHQVRDHKHSWR